MTRRSPAVWVAVALVVAVAAALGARSLAGPTPTAPPAPTPAADTGVVRFPPGAPQLASFKVQTAAEQVMPVAEPMNARVAYDENLTARVSSPIAGRVVGQHAEVGDAVRRGAPLLDIDSPDFAGADADWRKARADEVRKKLALDRAAGLLEHEVIPRKDYESAQADHQQAVAETRRASLRLRNLNAVADGSGRFALRAPIDGVVADRQVNPGLEVRPDLPNPLYVITDITRLWVIVDVPERAIAGIHPGQTVAVETDAWPGQSFSGRVERVGLVLDPGTRRIQVRCSVVNPDRRLRPEMFARVAFLADGQRRAVKVPNSALLVTGVGSSVFVERAAGVFEKRQVTVSVRGADASFIESGLAGGERVVSEGALLLDSEVSTVAR